MSLTPIPSFSFGLSSSKQKNSSSSTTNSTTMPVVPGWIDHTTQSIDRNIHRLGGSIPEALVAGADPLEKQAAFGASKLGADDDWFAQLMGAGAPSVQSANLLDNLDAYKSPYLRDVVDSTLADFDYDAGKTRAQQDLDIAGQGAFGGSGAALTRSLTAGELARARASTSANLRDQGFMRATTLSGQDADRRQAASVANAQFALQDAAIKGQLGLDKAASDRANIQSQADLGATMRDIDQKKISAPFDLLDWQIKAFGGLPTQLFVGSNEQSTSNATSKGKTSGWELGAALGFK